MHSYEEVHHGIQPAFQARTPYMVLLVDLDTQKGKPTEHEALRVVGNLATPDGILAPPDMVKRVGIGSRLRMVFSDVAPGYRTAAMDDRRGCDAAGKALALSTRIAGRIAGPPRPRSSDTSSSRKRRGRRTVRFPPPLPRR